MPKQPPIPVVTPHDANIVRLSPQLRALLRRRVTRQNRKEWNPEIQALLAQRAQLHQQLQRELAGIHNFTDSASQAIESIPLRGLHGRYKRQVAEDLAARAAAIQQSVPLLASEARSDALTAKQALANKILTARIDKKQAIESELQSAVNSATTDAQAAIKARESRQRSRRSDQRDREKEQRKARQERQHELNLAKYEIQRLFAANPDLAKQIHDGTAGPDVWAGLEERVRQAEGIGLAAARKAVAALRAAYETKGPLSQGIAGGLYEVADLLGH